jgi:choline dehydrogenase-like flavoprotein
VTDLATVAKQRWDAIIVGTGMGGATLGYSLARAGWRVLFCEKGRSTLQGADALRGDFAERHFARPEAPASKHRDVLLRAGRQADEISDLSAGQPRHFIPFLGAGTGGSSALYGMALERLFPVDFNPKGHHPHANDSSLQDSWPISYADLAPYYAKAERLYGVRGSRDPLKEDGGEYPMDAGPEFSPAAREIADFLRRKGMHPYRLPIGCEHVPGCRGCQGYLCARNCKHDSATTCLWPALHEHGATMMDECEVLTLETSGKAVTGVVCRRHGTEVRFGGSVVVLAAGALASPAVLLRSASPEQPFGLANESGMVGKNLMRHCVDLYAVFPGKGVPIQGNAKELGCNDLYLTANGKFGSIQSFGPMPPAALLLASVESGLRDAAGPWAAAPLRIVKPLLGAFLDRVFSRAVILATVLEDLPYVHNEVALADAADEFRAVAIRYRIGPAGAKRIAEFRRLMRSVLKPYRYILIKQAENNQRLAHVCGTCRFGSDPGLSVLDRHNKAHSLSNLYVVDASFFPSSGGANPALTIAANALRVADHLIARGNPRTVG